MVLLVLTALLEILLLEDVLHISLAVRLIVILNLKIALSVK